MELGSFYALTSLPIWVFLTVVITAIVHIAFSIGVYRDASSLQYEPSRLMFDKPGIWGLAVLIGGVFVAVAYWFVHHSNFAKK